MTLIEQVADGLAGIRGRIERAGGDVGAITIVAVTKGLDPAWNEAAAAVGLLDQGENHADALAAKQRALAGSTIRWHEIGQLQRRTIRSVAPGVVLWHGVDREAEGAEIARHAPGARVLVQVNTTAERQKGGCPPGDTEALVGILAGQGLSVEGLMTVGPGGDPESARPAFRMLAALAASLGLPTLSMGMSGDFEVAVQEGSTMVRIGTALFGPRPPVGSIQ